MATHRHKNTKTGIVIPDGLTAKEGRLWYQREYNKLNYRVKATSSERGQVFKRQERIISVSRVALQRLNTNKFSITIDKILRGEMVMAP